MGDLTLHLAADKPTLLVSLAATGNVIIGFELELGTLRSDAERERSRAWLELDSSASTTIRDRHARNETLPFSTEITVFEAQLRAAQVEYDFILLLINSQS